MKPWIVLRADIEVVPKETIVGQPLWRQNASTGKWYSVETGEEVQVETMSLKELLERMTDEEAG